MRWLLIVLFYFSSLQIFASDYYWVGGSGDWYDINHWATFSGGTFKQIVPPTTTDNVFFDNNSFTSTGQTVTVLGLQPAFCNSMDWTDALFNPTFSSVNDLKISGSLRLIEKMTFDYWGFTNFDSRNPEFITMAGKSFFNTIFFNGRGSWTMTDSLIVKSDLYLIRGTLNMSGNSLYINNLNSLTNSYNRTLNLANSKVFCTGDFLVDNSQSNKFILGKGTSSIWMSKNYAWLRVLGGLNFNNVYFSSNSRIYGNNNFQTLGFISNSIDSIESGKTQTINDSIIAQGTCHRPIVIRSTSNTVPTTIAKASGFVNLHYADLKNINTSGAAVFRNYGGFDNGNNLIWLFIPPSSRTLFWVGNSGNWSQEQHWSFSSGGTGGECIPSKTDDVFVDNQSFNTAGQALNININADVRDFVWNSTSQLAQFNGTNSFNSHGSFLLTNNLAYNFKGDLNFKGSTNQNISLENNLLLGDVHFQGNSYNLLSSLQMPSQVLFFESGTLVSNSYLIIANRFYSDYTNARSLQVGNSNLIIAGTSLSNLDYVWNVQSTNLILNSQGSKINFTGLNPSVLMGTALNYNQIVFSNNSGTSIFNGLNTIVDSLVMNANGIIKGSNTFAYLKLTPDYTYILEHAKTQTILNKLQMIGNKCIGLTIRSDLAGNVALISKSTGIIETDYVSLKDIQATGGAVFFAGSHSIDNGGNSGWVFAKGPSNLSPNLGADTLMMAGKSLTLDGTNLLGNGNTIFNWFNGSVLSTYTVSSPGRYWLTATYKPGCSLSDSINVYYATIDTLTCYNYKNASILITFDNVYSYTLKWSSGLTNRQLLNLSAGDYVFTINQQPSNETFKYTIKLKQPDSLMVDSVKVQDVSGCFGDKTGGLTIFASGGKPTYMYSIDNGLNFLNQSTFNNLKSDTFLIKLRDKNSCPMKVKKIFVGQPNIFKIKTLTSTKSCTNKNTGTITISTIGGTLPRLYSKDGLNYQIDSILVQMNSQKHKVFIKDSKNCIVNDTITVVAFKQVSLFVPSKDSVCIGSDLNINKDLAFDYLSLRWSTNGLGTFSDASLLHPIYTPQINESGLFQINLTGNGICDTAKVVMNFKINTLPNVQLGNDTAICINKNTLLNAGAGRKSYLWNNNTTKSTLLVSTAGKYKVEVEDFTGCKAKDSLLVSTDPIPLVNLPKDTSFCLGNEKILDPGINYLSYLWQDGSKTQSLKAKINGTYWVEVSNEFKCKNRDTIKITVFPLPNPKLGPDTALCQGESLFLKPGSFKSYLWQDGSFSSTFRINKTGLFWVQVSDTNKCINRDSMNLIVTPIPSVYLGEDTAICEGGKVVLDAGSGFVSYVWSNGVLGQKQTVTKKGLYSVTVKGLAACKATSSRSVTVNPVLPVSLGRDTMVCVDTKYLLRVPDIYSSYRWQNNWSADTMLIEKAGFYWLEVTNEFACPFRDTIAVSVEQYPQFTIGKDTSICYGQALYLSPGIGFKSYLWNTKDTLATIRAAATNTYTVKVGNRCGYTSKSIRLNVWPVPFADAGSDRTICLGDTIKLKASGGTSSLWSNGATKDTSFIPQKTQTYSVIVSDGRCGAMDTVQIKVNKRPKIKAVEVNIHGDLYVIPEYGTRPYLFSLSGRQFVPKDRFYSLPQGHYNIDMTDSSGCVTSYDSIFVKPTDQVFIPSVFTPNGDGINDTFEIPGLKDKENVFIQIFDQHGMLLVQYAGNDIGWDGKYHNIEMPSDAYWYLISINKRNYKTGFIALKR